MSPVSFLVDVDKCSGCGLCVVACKDEHVDSSYMPWTAAQPATAHFWMRLQTIESGSLPRVSVSHLPIMCQHCANAPCIKACPENAIKRREDGLVWIDQDLCTGCGLCQAACPYDVIYMNGELDVAQKCTGCAHRVDEGLEPRCVDICPHEALVFGDQAAMSEASVLDGAEAFHPEFNADPLVVWKGLPKASVSGLVIDGGSQEVLAGVEVTATDLHYDRLLTTFTDEFGDFWIKGLESGRRYLVAVRAAGYASRDQVLKTELHTDLGDVSLVRSGDGMAAEVTSS